MNRDIITSLLTFFLMATSLNSQAEIKNTSWYQLEVILFAQNGGNDHLTESWHDKQTIHWPKNMVLLKPYIAGKSVPSSTARAIRPTADRKHQPSPLQGNQQANSHEATDLARKLFALLPPDQLQLTGFASRIKKSSSLRLLAHIAWRQPINHGELAQPVLIQAGKHHGLEFEVEGTLSVRQNRYMHASTQLIFSKFSSAATDSRIDWSAFSEPSLLPKDPSKANIWSSSQDVHLFNTGREKSYSRTLSAMIDSSERITENTITYFDHPLFGLVIKVIPFDPVMEMKPFMLDNLPKRRSNLTQEAPVRLLP